MPLNFSPIHFFQYALKREATQFFASIAIRSFAMGMVTIFEVVYIYVFFNSIPLAILFYAAMHGLYSFIVIFSARIMSKIGLKHSILLSHFLFIVYYISLFFIPQYFFLIPITIILGAIAMSFFWPAFSIDFTRFSEKGYQGREVGKINIALYLPTIISPIIGGFILKTIGYPGLFIAVLVVLLASSIPMFLSKETHIVYSDSFKGALDRVFKKKNIRTSLGIFASGSEIGIDVYIWPIFMFVLAIDFTMMGGITTFSLLVAALFTLYMGRMSDSVSNRVWFLNIGAFLTAIAWIIKYFVLNPFDAFLGQTLYKLCRSSARIPFQTFIYRKASLKGQELDEFIVYREIVGHFSKALILAILAGVFFFIPQLNIAFIVAAVLSLGLVFIGVPPKFKW